MLFVAATALVYFLFSGRKHQWVVLLVSSYVFYLYTGYRYAAFLVITTLSTYAVALWIDRIGKTGKQMLKDHKADWDKETKKACKEQIKRKKRWAAATALVLNLGILAFLKYYNFFAGSLASLMGAQAPALKLFLPLGISFYTFQSVGYVMDVYREKVAAERNVLKVALFVSFFPQIVQGPISFYDQLAHQLYEPHRFDFTRLKHGGELILWGFFKKLVIADRAIIAINAVVDRYSSVEGGTLFFTVLLYALQLYADFSGGIDISRGVAQIFGIHLTDNFRRPYFATSINDYWRRWHITLGAWMKEHVFYPIALSHGFAAFSKKIRQTRFGKTAAGQHVAKVLPTSIASLIVFLLVGVWHGADWKYVAFGLWNGGVIMLSTLLEPVFEHMAMRLHINVKSFGFRLFQMLRTFLVVLVGYVFDIAPDFYQAMYTFGHVFTSWNASASFAEIAQLGLHIKEFWLLGICTVLLLTVSIIQERHSETTVRVLIDRKPFILRFVMLFVGIMVLLIFGIYGPGYNPAEFVYMNF